MSIAYIRFQRYRDVRLPISESNPMGQGRVLDAFSGADSKAGHNL